MDKVDLVGGIDAKSLYDHVKKPGSMPSERRLGDLWAAREIFEKEGQRGIEVDADARDACRGLDQVSRGPTAHGVRHE